MKRFLPVILALILVGGGVFLAVRYKKGYAVQHPADKSISIGTFAPERPCVRLPQFLRALHIPQPIVIDLSQKRYTGVALHYGFHLSKTFHPKQWEQYEHFSTYALDKQGNIYLIPTPYISIHPTTFTLQKKIFKLDTHTGRVAIFMDFDDVRPTPNNPYGMNAVAYDCDDQTLWAAAIDESDYREEKGVIYHIDPGTKTIRQRVTGFDALTLKIVHASTGKYLLAGSARTNGLYAFAITRGVLIDPPVKLASLPDPNEHIRKIKVTAANQLELQSIPFTYSLIARTAKRDRTYFAAKWDPVHRKWKITKKNKDYSF